MDQLKALPQPYHHFFKNVSIPADDGWAVAESLINGDLMIGGDGSVKNRIGTHGYKLLPPCGNSIEGAGQSHGTLEGMSSLRAEHHGEIAILLIISGLCTFFGITGGPTTSIHIDNKEVVERGTKQMEKREKLRDYDLWSVSRELRQKLPIAATNSWIKAHQDDGDTPSEDLSPAANINIDVDKLAGDYQDIVQGTGPELSPHYGPEQVSIFLLGKKITHDIRKTVENYYNGKQTRCYIIKKFNWTGRTFNLVDWNALEGAMNAYPSSQLTNITKFAYRWQNCRAQTLQFDTASELSPINHKKYLCPMCGTELETSDHVLQCHNKRSVTQYSTSRFLLGKKLSKLKTPDRLTAAIKYGLRMYSSSSITARQQLSYETDFHSDLNIQIDKAFVAQSSIGWDNFCRGFVSKEWAKCMEMHYARNYSGNITLSSDRWATRLITLLQEYGLSAWNYRNSIVHGESDSNFLTKAELKKQIARCFELQTFLGAEYSGLFTTTKSERLQQKTQTARLWIATIDAVHKEKSKRLKQEALLLAMQAQ